MVFLTGPVRTKDRRNISPIESYPADLIGAVFFMREGIRIQIFQISAQSLPSMIKLFSCILKILKRYNHR